MQDPILEALNFAVDNSLTVGYGAATTSRNSDPTAAGTLSSNQCSSSAAVLNLDKRLNCVFRGCDFLSLPVSDYSKLKENDIFEHLLVVHHFVIDKVEEVADIYRYLSYWREKFLSGNILDYCVSIMMDRPLVYDSSKREMFKQDESAGEAGQTGENKYYMLTSLLPEDKALRDKLWTSRLEAVLEVNRIEREATDFAKQCLFCKELSAGNRRNLFDHMSESHGFHVGQPDNIVFVNELIDVLNDQLEKLICIYCAKTFKDKAVLREHMRKKQHRKINASFGEYDKFYVINYLEPGKTWKSLDDEDLEDEKKEEEWLEARDDEPNIVCLFCTERYSSFEAVLEHLNSEHHFHFENFTNSLSFYQKVKFVNFVRRGCYQNVCFLCDKKFLERKSLTTHLNNHFLKNDHQKLKPSSWDRPELFFPTYENDQFLVMLDEPNDSSAQEPNTVVIPEDIPIITSSDLFDKQLPRL